MFAQFKKYDGFKADDLNVYLWITSVSVASNSATFPHLVLKSILNKVIWQELPNVAESLEHVLKDLEPLKPSGLVANKSFKAV